MVKVKRFSTNKVVVKKVAKPKIKTVSVFDLNSVIFDIYASFKSALNKPLVVLSMLFIWGIIMTHSESFTNGPIGKWANANKGNITIANWIHENQLKFVGAAVFVPSLLDLPKDNTWFVGFGVLLWILLVPEHSVFQYLVQSLCLHTFFKVRLSETRLLLIAVVVASYFFGEFIFIKTNMNKTNNNTN